MLDIFLSTTLKEVQIGDLVISPQKPINKWQIITTDTGFLGGLPYFTPKNIESYQIKSTPYFVMTKKSGQQLEVMFLLTTEDGTITDGDIKELYHLAKLYQSNVRVRLTNEADKVAQFYGTFTGNLAPSYYGGSDKGYVELVFTTNSDRLFGETRRTPITLNTPLLIENKGITAIYPKIKFTKTSAEALTPKELLVNVKWLISHNDGIQPNYIYDLDLRLSTAYDEFAYLTYADYILSTKPNSNYAPLVGLTNIPVSSIHFKNSIPYRYGVCIPEGAKVEITVTSADLETSATWKIELIQEVALIDE